MAEEVKEQIEKKSVKTLNPSLDFVEDGVVVGFKVETVDSNGTLYEDNNILFNNNEKLSVIRSLGCVHINSEPHYLRHQTLPSIDNKWTENRITNFIRTGQYDKDVAEKIADTSKTYIEYPDENYRLIIALWIIATYLHPVFTAFPFLFFIGPKESGKSQALEFLQLTCFNSVKLTTLTQASLGDLVDTNRSTILIDQAERISSNLVGILADSYKKSGGKRQIIERKNGKRIVRTFSTYGPKAFAAIENMHYDIQDRCLSVSMLHSDIPKPSIIGEEPIWMEIRDACYRFAILKHNEIRTAYHDIQAQSNRQGELWKPLQAIAKVLNIDNIDILQDEFYRGTGKNKYKLSLREDALFQVLYDSFNGKDEIEITASQILEQMELLLEDHEMPDHIWVGQTIKLFSLAKEKRKRTRKKLIHYVFRKDQVDDLIKRYKANVDRGTA